MIFEAIDRSNNLEAFSITVAAAQEVRSTQNRDALRAFGRAVEHVREYTMEDPRLQEERNGQVRPAASRRIGVQNYVQHADGAGRATYTRNTNIIQPLLVEFAADVELTARRILTPEEFDFFKRVYLQEMIEIDEEELPGPGSKATTFTQFVEQRYSHDNMQDTVRAYDLSIRERLGAEFLRQGIVPVEHYFKAIDVRMKKETKY
jgi:hypothetical protein